jgi:hypothetical protein
MERFLAWRSSFVVSHGKQSGQKMFRAVSARAALSAATAGECRDAVLVAGAQVHDLGAVLDRQCDGLLAGSHWHLETIKTVGPPDACGASRSWHQLAEWEQCGEIDSARLTVVVGRLTIKRPQCPDPCSARPPGLPSLRLVPS